MRIALDTNVYRYRLYFSTPVQSQDDTQVVRRLAADLHAYTVYTAAGVWDGQQEHSYIVEYLGRNDEESAIITLAKTLKEYFAQDAVLITKDAIAMQRV